MKRALSVLPLLVLMGCGCARVVTGNILEIAQRFAQSVVANLLEGF